jgi:tRNA A-37 threonylcarbamoyl transferase component Bud32
MADVYKAFHTGLAVYRAVKVIRPEFVSETGFKERFQREAQAVAALRHPNIVQMHDFGVQDNLYYMVMEFIEGQDLKSYLTQHGQIRPFSQVMPIIEPVASALGYAHQRGVVHRDIKPANIMLTQENQVILTDFGIAKMLALEERMTQTGMGIGTPAYMSPEQARGQSNVGPPADIYSLGVVLYEMLTGRVPFSADTPLAVMLKVVSDPMPPPREFSPDIPDVLQGVVLKATAKDLAQRYQTAEALVDGLKRSLGMTPGAAPPADLLPPDEQPTLTPPARATTVGAARPKTKKARQRQTPWLLIGAGVAIFLCLFVGLTAAAVYFWLRPAPSLTAWQFVVDASQGMNETINDRTKMDIARAALAKELEILPRNVNASLRVFGGGASGGEPCQDTRLLVEPASGQGGRLANALAGVTPSGEAPLTEAIVQAIGDFDLTRDTHNTLIIITAGLDTCEANAVEQLEILSERLGIEFDLQLIGLGVSEADRIQLEEIAEAAGGEYHDAQSEEDIRQVVAEAVAELPGASASQQSDGGLTAEGQIPLGEYISGEITTPEATASYMFQAAAGQMIYFEVQETSAGTYFILTAPDGRTELFNIYNSDRGPLLLEATGSYTLTVDPDDENVPTYAFIIWSLDPPVIEGGAIEFGQFTGGEIETPGQTAKYTFEATAEQTIYFDVQATSEGTYFQLMAPDGRTELFNIYNSDQGPVTLEAAGVYTLMVDPDNANKPSYEFIVWDVNPPVIEGGAIEFGQFTGGEIETPGQMAKYTFEATAGQTIYFDVQETSAGTYFILTAPDGRTEVFNIYNSDQGPIVLEAAGVYTLMVDPDNANKPSYEFIVWDVNPPVIEGGAIEFGQFTGGEIETPGQTAKYTFEATAGQTIYFDVQETSAGTYFILTAPDGRTEVFNIYNSDQGPVVLEAAGVYTLMVDPDNANKPSYEFIVWDVNPPVIEGGAIELGKFVSGEIETPGQTASYTFEGTSGQNILFDVQSTSEGTYFILYAPDGRTELFNVYNNDAGPVQLAETGTYTLIVDPDNANKPAYEFVIQLQN